MSDSINEHIRVWNLPAAKISSSNSTIESTEAWRKLISFCTAGDILKILLMVESVWGWEKSDIVIFWQIFFFLFNKSLILFIYILLCQQQKKKRWKEIFWGEKSSKHNLYRLVCVSDLKNIFQTFYSLSFFLFVWLAFG